jgi:hypothetical protein
MRMGPTAIRTRRWGSTAADAAAGHCAHLDGERVPLIDRVFPGRGCNDLAAIVSDTEASSSHCGGASGAKQKATAKVAFLAKRCKRLGFVWLPDLGSNQGPTD